MAADRYQLAAVRDARAREEQGKRGELASSVGDAREARARLEAAQARTAKARQALATAVTAREAVVAGPTPAQMARIANADRFVARRRHELDDALAEEIRAQSSHAGLQLEVDVRLQVLARARADREVIDRHFARWREAKRKLAERRED